MSKPEQPHGKDGFSRRAFLKGSGAAAAATAITGAQGLAAGEQAPSVVAGTISVDGSSGGSTVLLDGKPVSANSVLAIECVGKSIETVESLADDPIPAAFVHHDASQCGFCTPGFVIAVKAFVTKHPNATEADIREGLNGNLCRCGTYAGIIPAVLDVVKGAGNG